MTIVEDKFIELIVGTGIFSLIYSYLKGYMFVTLFEIELTKSQIFKFVLVDSIFNGLCLIFFPVMYFKAISIIISIVLFKTFMKAKIEDCILGESINSIILICLELIYYVIYKNSICINLAVFVCFCFAVICFIVKITNIKLKIYERINIKNKCITVLVLSLDAIIIGYYTIEIFRFIKSIPLEIVCFIVFSLVLFFYISVKNVLRVSKLEEQAQSINNLELYNKTLTIMYDSIRGFKHDFSNFIQSLDGYIQTDDIEGIKSMSSSVSMNCREVCNMGVLVPNIINNPAVYSLVTNKYYLANEAGITFNVEVMMNFEELQIDVYDLCTVLGVLLDNSIEAAKECEKKIINLRFVKDFKTNKKIIIVENSYNDFNIDIGKIFEKGYSSKIEKKEHGLGLWNVKRILKKFKNVKLVTSNDTMFRQRLEFE